LNGNDFGICQKPGFKGQIRPTSVFAQDSQIAKVVKIGQPSREKYPTNSGADCWFRSVCDMHTYNGRVYIGSGWIGAQVGSTYLWSFDKNEIFTKHFSVNDEQVPSPSSSFHEYDGKLFFTGGDPEGTTGMLFIKDGEKWLRKDACIPNVHKCGDVALYKENLYVIKSPYGYSETGGDLVKSSDMGQTWSYAMKHILSEHSLSFRMMAPFDDFLLIMGRTNVNAGYSKSCVFKYHDDGNMETLSIPLCPSWEGHFNPRRLVRFKDGVLYTPDRDTMNISPRPLFFLNDFENGARLIEKFKTESVFDVIVRNETCYVLTASQESDNEFKGQIYSSSDLENWTEVTAFLVEALPYSLELLEGQFYVGLGNRWHVKFADAESGSIYRIDIPKIE